MEDAINKEVYTNGQILELIASAKADGWKLAQQIMVGSSGHNAMTKSELVDALGTADYDIIFSMSADEVEKKIESYKQSMSFELGEELIWNGQRVIVMKDAEPGKKYLACINKSCAYRIDVCKYDVQKTGIIHKEFADVISALSKEA